MLKFDELLRKGIPKNTNDYSNIPDQYSIMWEWQRFYDECKKFTDKVKNRKSIVDFKIHDKEEDK